MKVCYDPGVLQAFLDGEVSGSKKDEIERHLENCDSCWAVLDEVRRNQNFSDTVLNGLLQATGGTGIDTDAAWSRFSQRTQLGRNNKKGVFQLLSRYRFAAAAAFIVIAFSVAFSFSSVRTAAGDKRADAHYRPDSLSLRQSRAESSNMTAPPPPSMLQSHPRCRLSVIQSQPVCYP